MEVIFSQLKLRMMSVLQKKINPEEEELLEQIEKLNKEIKDIEEKFKEFIEKHNLNVSL